MQDAQAPPAAVREFAARLADDLAGLLGDALVGAYLHGSAVLGGWTASRSDTDILIVLADGVSHAQIKKAGTALLVAATGAPGCGLECSAVRAGAAAAPGPPWPFELHVAERDGAPVVISGQDVPGDEDLLMHYAVAREAGLALAGPPPRQLIGPVPRPLILSYLAGELDWGLVNAPESYAVLNACRALVYLRQGDIVSKLAGGEIAISQSWGPAQLIASAIDQQLGREAQRPPGEQAKIFVARVAAELSAVA